MVSIATLVISLDIGQWILLSNSIPEKGPTPRKPPSRKVEFSKESKGDFCCKYWCINLFDHHYEQENSSMVEEEFKFHTNRWTFCWWNILGNAKELTLALLILMCVMVNPHGWSKRKVKTEFIAGKLLRVLHWYDLSKAAISYAIMTYYINECVLKSLPRAMSMTCFVPMKQKKGWLAYSALIPGSFSQQSFCFAGLQNIPGNITRFSD